MNLNISLAFNLKINREFFFGKEKTLTTSNAFQYYQECPLRAHNYRKLNCATNIHTSKQINKASKMQCQINAP